MGIFKKRQYGVINITNLEEKDIPVVPDGTWIKCSNCGKILYKKSLEENYSVCLNCNYHFRLGSYERINQICDKGTFKEFNKYMKSKNPMDFQNYEEKLKANKEKSKTNEAVVTGECEIGGNKAIIAFMDSNFLMGSMGTVVGEKITIAVEEATKRKLPIIIFTASGGARMQEGIFSLMQMAKISSALSRHSDAGLLYITVLTDPTTGGVTASFAMLGDIILAEPKALVGFAGRRVIEGTIKEKLPEDFQSAEFLLEHGFIDNIIKRDNLKMALSALLNFHIVKEV
ncbi:MULTISPECIES: acetyl-CoA carboxylase, carboxyltransferase subunit beta [unclassified Clostridium]|uniref:acetyl-CoA carboxylase, carboxyltransferase subunit beta n=1 Tax=unclassified Clostridium TaxID=2614128 RepID=UPI002A75BF8B|nr:acetyl-CoA carboxylase, carboxyltransferase subunit beta [Clostridium sp.]MCI6692392.1 acetyl-CoA carboxylase, carboxyltransferase subunit beta [Clostridium sp.]MDY2632099.1 acetyl-CoA carboxylase, carboxyltransferase subunit beta [Clostridium sp.]